MSLEIGKLNVAENIRGHIPVLYPLVGQYGGGEAALQIQGLQRFKLRPCYGIATLPQCTKFRFHYSTNS